MTEAQLIQEVKKRMAKVDTDKHGDYITTMVPDYLEVAEEWTNNSFRSKVPSSIILFIASSIEYKLTANVGVESRRLGDVSYNYETDYPKSVTRLLRPHKKVRLYG